MSLHVSKSIKLLKIEKVWLMRQQKEISTVKGVAKNSNVCFDDDSNWYRSTLQETLCKKKMRSCLTNDDVEISHVWVAEINAKNACHEFLSFTIVFSKKKKIFLCFAKLLKKRTEFLFPETKFRTFRCRIIDWLEEGTDEKIGIVYVNSLFLRHLNCCRLLARRNRKSWIIHGSHDTSRTVCDDDNVFFYIRIGWRRRLKSSFWYAKSLLLVSRELMLMTVWWWQSGASLSSGDDSYDDYCNSSKCFSNYINFFKIGIKII